MARRASTTSPAFIAAGIALFTIAASLPAFFAAGPEMDEGTLLAYPSFILEHGFVPGRDFESFYGPAQPYLLAGLGSILGLSQTLERVTGLLFELTIVLSLYLCALPVGRWLAALGAAAAALALIGIGVMGLAVLGALAALMAGLALLLARPPGDEGQKDGPPWPPVGAGALAALCLSFRPDFAPVILLTVAPLLLWRVKGVFLSRDARWWLLAFAIGSIPLVAWVAVVGPDDLMRLADDLRSSREGRALPLPGPTTTVTGLVAATGLVAFGAAAAAFVLLRRDRFSWDGRVMLAITLLLVALMPATLERADSAHVFPVAAIALGLAPLVLRELVDLRAGSWSSVGLVAISAVVVIAGLHVAIVTLHAQAIELRGSEQGVKVANGDRKFLIDDPEAAADLNALIPEVDARTEPGDTIFVGPSDLTRTVYSDTFLYFLFPDLMPASIYTELNAGTANGPDSELPKELESADVLLLTDRHEPDTAASAEPGSDAAQRVLEDRFCRVASRGSYEVLVPCAGAS